MILRILTCLTLLLATHISTCSGLIRDRRDRCHTSDMMTDLQSWVDDEGNVIVGSAYTKKVVDVSKSNNPTFTLRNVLNRRKSNSRSSVEYLSMAKCQLKTIPRVFDIRDNSNGRLLSDTVKYLTFFGNDFKEYGFNSLPANAECPWAAGLRNVHFNDLRELDLRHCSIQALGEVIFSGMTSLEALYLSGNQIVHISARAFIGLGNLVHLDMSRNVLVDDDRLSWEFGVFNHLPNLTSLDLSNTRLSQNRIYAFKRLGRNFQKLSLCHTGLEKLEDNLFENTSLSLLDVTGNNGILNEMKSLGGIEDKLEILYADAVALKTVKIFKGFRKLKILKLNSNEIEEIHGDVAESWENLKVLSLDDNRITSWFTEIYSLMKNLKVLSIALNNIHVISSNLIKDVEHVKYLGLRDNFFVCSCDVKELFDISTRNNAKYKNSVIEDLRNDMRSTKSTFHYLTSLEFLNELLNNNTNMTFNINDHEVKQQNENFILYDYTDEAYQCLVPQDGQIVPFSELEDCSLKKSNMYDDAIIEGWNKVLLLWILPSIVLVGLFIGFYFKRSFKIFFIAFRNSAMLSLISDSKDINEDTIFNYDIFVSYCNEDRAWVLDHLLPQVERDCSVSVCLHERDFQVGLSILENIVSCMDRSRSIMLVISHRFLLSQWCQFEMHLAQHRLLETRREDLILVLLEDIPRRMRPNTLHYLMLTKTYVLWPKNETEEIMFWKRLKRCIITQKMKHQENVSLV